MVIHLSESWPWLLVFFTGLAILLFQYLKDETPDGKSKTKVNTGIFFFGLFLLLGSLIQTCNSEVSQALLASNLDTTKRNVDSTKTLLQISTLLTKQIDSLQHLHIKLDSSTQNLVNESKEISEENLLTTRNLNSVTENAKHIVDKVYDEATAGNSIPLVYGFTYKDAIPDDLYEYMKWNYKSPSGKYIMNLEVVNTGDYKLSDVSIISNEERYRNPPEVISLYEGHLLPKDKKELIHFEMCPLIPDSLTDTITHYYLAPMGVMAEERSFSIYVHWRTTTYEYLYSFTGTGTRTLSIIDRYRYKGKIYDRKGLITAIMNDKYLEKEIMKNSN